MNVWGVYGLFGKAPPAPPAEDPSIPSPAKTPSVKDVQSLAFINLVYVRSTTFKDAKKIHDADGFDYRVSVGHEKGSSASHVYLSGLKKDCNHDWSSRIFIGLS